ncbi:MAG: aminotransferase class III-fold pyridoxal phosphate-dependent enzyme, partial [Bacteroidetes bacterium]|nr:aminotransferase class III-fold pyridoxal phosphate-dependent enzyme [Bacteroidota bacterium]
VAALILEPVAGNMGCIAPRAGYLEGLRKICDREGIVLIFDEVMTGFRLAKGGAQERFGVQADLTTLGKIIGGGMPVGAYGGRREIMEFVSPAGPVYQAGTLSGNPIAMAAGLAMLNQLNSQPDFYQQLEATSNQIVADLRETLSQLGLRYTINQVGSMYSLFFTTEEVWDYDSAKAADTALFGRYFREMLERGVYLAPSQFETLFVSQALGQKELQQLKKVSFESLRSIIS